jgi:hypothetical protein
MEKSETKICKQCQKNFLITIQEQAFYDRKKLPQPLNCSECRRNRRASLRNPRKLYKRTCDNCKIPLQSTYPTTSPYAVYCEKCYLETLGDKII